jgi:GNAT superfamily N-acetyltransferase
VHRSLGRHQTRFTALAGGQAIGHCECSADLTQGGALPALRGWAELGEIEVAEEWRHRGVGTWLIGHAATWLRLGGCERAVFSVAAENEAAGAGRLYQRLGWNVLARHQIGWRLNLGGGI